MTAFPSLPCRVLRMLARVVFALAVLQGVGVPGARADIILFTASTDNTGGADPVGVPGTNNPNIPGISSGVTLTPGTASFDGNITGPLNGITYGPYGFGANGGGNTGWVNTSFTATQTSDYRLVWEVAGADPKIGSALLTDNVQINGVVKFGFESGLPTGSLALGSVGTSGALNVTDASGNPLAPFSATEGSKFAWLDTTGQNAPIYDSTDPYLGSRLVSAVFHLNAGDVLSLDAAFLTNEGSPFQDYGLVALQAVPEPASLTLLACGSAAALGLCSGRTRRKRGKNRTRDA